MTRTKGGIALVTGGHGFLGSHLVDLLLEEGYAVRCLLRPGRDAASLFGDRGGRVEAVRGDLRRADGLEDAVAGAALVFHLAGLTFARGPAEYFAVNAAGTRRFAEAVGRAAPGCRRFLYVSSQAAAGPSTDGRAVTEDAPPNPLTHYGKSKLAGERVLEEALGPVPFTVVRPPAIYGPRDEAILPFFQAASWGVAPGLEGRGRRFNLLHARDVAEGMLAAARAPAAAGRCYFLSDGRGYGYPELRRALESAFGRPSRRIPLPDGLVTLAAALAEEVAVLAGAVPLFGRQKAIELKQRWWLCSGERAARELSWRPRIPLERGFLETAAWYAERGLVRAGREAGAGSGFLGGPRSPL